MLELQAIRVNGTEAGENAKRVAVRSGRRRAELKNLIVNADDLGWTEGVNRGIVDAHRAGVCVCAGGRANEPATGRRGAPEPERRSTDGPRRGGPRTAERGGRPRGKAGKPAAADCQPGPCARRSGTRVGRTNSESARRRDSTDAPRWPQTRADAAGTVRDCLAAGEETWNPRDPCGARGVNAAIGARVGARTKSSCGV